MCIDTDFYAIRINNCINNVGTYIHIIFKFRQSNKIIF